MPVAWRPITPASVLLALWVTASYPVDVWAADSVASDVDTSASSSMDSGMSSSAGDAAASPLSPTWTRRGVRPSPDIAQINENVQRLYSEKLTPASLNRPWSPVFSPSSNPPPSKPAVQDTAYFRGDNTVDAAPQKLAPSPQMVPVQTVAETKKPYIQDLAPDEALARIISPDSSYPSSATVKNLATIPASQTQGPVSAATVQNLAATMPLAEPPAVSAPMAAGNVAATTSAPMLASPSIEAGGVAVSTPPGSSDSVSTTPHDSVNAVAAEVTPNNLNLVQPTVPPPPQETQQVAAISPSIMPPVPPENPVPPPVSATIDKSIPPASSAITNIPAPDAIPTQAMDARLDLPQTGSEAASSSTSYLDPNIGNYERAWSMQIQALEAENQALRQRAQLGVTDPLKDIKVDAVAQIHEEVLRDRISELEKELDKRKASDLENLPQKTDGGKEDIPVPSIPMSALQNLPQKTSETGDKKGDKPVSNLPN